VYPNLFRPLTARWTTKFTFLAAAYFLCPCVQTGFGIHQRLNKIIDRPNHFHLSIKNAFFSHPPRINAVKTSNWPHTICYLYPVHEGYQVISNGEYCDLHSWDIIIARLLGWTTVGFNTLNAELNPICHLLALFGAHHILHVNR
jgi:hypothetical protein